MSRIRRALRHTHRVEFLHSVMPAVITAVAAAAGSLQVKKTDDSLGIVIVPLLWGLAGFAGTLLLIHGGEFLYRLVTGKAPKGHPRTLEGLNKTKLERQLRENMPISFPSVVIDHQGLEVENFAKELRSLLDRCGWNVPALGFWAGSQSDVMIEMPIQGSPGLKALAEFLNHYGYTTTVIPSIGGGSSGFITVGEMSWQKP